MLFKFIYRDLFEIQKLKIEKIFGDDRWKSLQIKTNERRIYKNSNS